MGCSCGSAKKEGKVAGCKNNGSCASGGCNKMDVFDWLSDMDLPFHDRFDVVEIRFKGGRKEFFRNIDGLDLATGDAVVVDVPNGHHIGYVSLQGELVRLQMRKKKVEDNDDIRKIYRKANLKDLEKFERARKREMSTLYRTRQIILEQKLEMKLSDIEYQADNGKATFFYSADERVDFRELIKVLAAEFKVRIEMRQISLRQEAGRLGGVGSCGRELCCSTWLSDFKSVSTSAARYQNLSLNPGKLSGQCGRLKCCLNYELDTYIEALTDIPEVNTALKTQKGEAKLMKTDIFRRIMWFNYAEDSNWHAVGTERVKEVMSMNQKGEIPHTLLENVMTLEEESSSINSDLVKIDKKYRNKNKGNRKGGGRKRRVGQGNNRSRRNPGKK